jgi:hypothetical protein
MPSLKEKIAPLLARALESLTLAIELFNRPLRSRPQGLLD